MQAVKDEICPFGSGVRISIQSLVLFSAFSPEKKFRIFFQYFVVRFVEMAVKCQIEKHISGRADIAQLFSDVQVTFFLTESVPAEIPHPFQLTCHRHVAFFCLSGYFGIYMLGYQNIILCHVLFEQQTGGNLHGAGKGADAAPDRTQDASD